MVSGIEWTDNLQKFEAEVMQALKSSSTILGNLMETSVCSTYPNLSGLQKQPMEKTNELEE